MLWVRANDTRMNSEDDELVIINGQISVEVNGDIIALININLKAKVLKVLGYIAGEILVGIIAVKLVNDGCARAFRDRWSDELRPVKSNDNSENSDK